MDKSNKIIRGKKRFVSNAVYSILVFTVLLSLGIGILSPSSFEDTSHNVQPSAGAFLIFAISMALTIVFSICYGRKTNR